MPLFLVCFPSSCSTVHHWMLGCLGNSIQGSSQQCVPGECFNSMCGGFCAIWAVSVFLLLVCIALCWLREAAQTGSYNFWGMGSERKELSIFQRYHHHHRIQVTIQMLVASHCVPSLVSVWSMFFWTVLCWQLGTWDNSIDFHLHGNRRKNASNSIYMSAQDSPAMVKQDL